MTERVGFVGLGTMGAPMAGHLLRAGVDLTVWNRTAAKAEPLREAGAKVAPELAALARDVDTVLLCVTREEDVQACLDGLADGFRPGMLVVDHSTVPPAAAVRWHAELGARGVDFVDAPVTGGSMGAVNGSLTIFLGGEEAPVARAQAVIAPYTAKSERVGGPGSGQWMKLTNQIGGVGALLGLCEAMAFAERAGLDLDQVIRLVGSGAAGSWAFDKYGPKIIARDWSPGFSVANQRKDLDYCESAAAQLGIDLPGFQLVNDLLAAHDHDAERELATPILFESLLRRGPAE